MMLRSDPVLCLMKIEGNDVLQLDHLKGSESHWRWQAENIRQEGSGANLVGAPNDCVFQLYAHMDLLTSMNQVRCVNCISTRNQIPARASYVAVDTDDLESKIQVS